MDGPAHLFFEDFRLDLRNEVLWRGAEQLVLTPKAFSLLRFMARNPDRLLSKEEILDAVWPGLHVTEAVLKENVRQLRAALGESAAQPRFIATVHRRGYRFLPHVRRRSLPIPVNRLLGRARELSALETALRSAALVTLTGAGGTGKTRLALELGHGLAPGYPDGVLWVELAQVASSSEVDSAVARNVGVREAPGRALADCLLAALGSRQALLVLDNCEHLVEQVARLAGAMLAAAPQLRVLATSREALGVPGEIVLPLAPLPVPAAEANDPEALAESASVGLLVERIRALVPDFHLDEESVAPVARICRRLDGVPLALELAAARVPGLGVGEVADRLDDALGLLTSGSRVGEPRHRTLAAALEWSVRLLTEPERRLFRRLAVFAGGFSLDEAEAVCADDPLPHGAIAEHLSQLVGKSLVETTPAAAGRLRYRLLEPVRQMASAELARSGDGEAGFDRHAGLFVARAAEAESGLESGERTLWLPRLDVSLDDLRAAMRHGLAAPRRRQQSLALAASLLWFWYHRGLWSEGCGWLEAALEAPGPASPGELGRASSALGVLEFFRGRYPAALARLLRAAELLMPNDVSNGAVALSFLGMVLLADGDAGGAVVRCSEAAAALEPAGGWRHALALINHGIALRHTGDLAEARRLHEASASTFRAFGDDWGLAMALRNLGMIDALEGRHDAAAALYRESLRHLSASGERWFLSRAMEELAAVLMRRGEGRRAARLLGAAESLRDSVGAPIVPFYEARYRETCDALRAALGPEALGACWQEGRSLSTEAALDEALGDPDG